MRPPSIDVSLRACQRAPRTFLPRPLSTPPQVITDFFDVMKSRSKGYASMEYKVSEYRENDLVRLDILINGEQAQPLSAIVHREAAFTVGKGLTRKLKDLIPRQLFKVPIQAAVGQKIVPSAGVESGPPLPRAPSTVWGNGWRIHPSTFRRCRSPGAPSSHSQRRAHHHIPTRQVASSAISPIRKDVLAKCYGGDISRKKKLLNKQAKGKKRMKAIGKVNVPQEAFMAVLNLKD